MDWWNLVRRSFLINTTTKKQVVAGAGVLGTAVVVASTGLPLASGPPTLGPHWLRVAGGGPGECSVHKSVCSIPRGRVAGAAAAWLLVLDTNL